MGRNVLINVSDREPFITNDGVTIAENITSDDIVVQTILEILKEASLKTNEVVGDGTTTTLVLLEAILKEILQAILQYHVFFITFCNIYIFFEYYIISH